MPKCHLDLEKSAFLPRYQFLSISTEITFLTLYNSLRESHSARSVV